MLKRNSRLLLGLMAATPLLFAACTDNSNIFGPNDAAGTYQLTVYAGRSVPTTFTIQPGDVDYPNGAQFRVVDGNLILSTNGTFIETNNYVITPTGEPTFNDSFTSSGTWQLNGTTLTLSAPVQNKRPARFLTATLTVDSFNETINYQEDSGNGPEAFEYQR